MRLLRFTPPEELRLRELLPVERPLRELLPEELRLLVVLRDELRLFELPPELDLLPELRELLDPERLDDFDPLREDPERVRFFDPEALLRPELLDPPLERPLEPRCDCRP